MGLSGFGNPGVSGFRAIGLRAVGVPRGAASRGWGSQGRLPRGWLPGGDAACPCGARCASPPASIKILDFISLHIASVVLLVSPSSILQQLRLCGGQRTYSWPNITSRTPAGARYRSWSFQALDSWAWGHRGYGRMGFGPPGLGPPGLGPPGLGRRCLPLRGKVRAAPGVNVLDLPFSRRRVPSRSRRASHAGEKGSGLLASAPCPDGQGNTANAFPRL